METERVKAILKRELREKPETQRASRKMGNIDFSKLRHMGLNENVFGMSPKALEAISEAAKKSHFYFMDSSPTGLKATIAEKFGLSIQNVVTGAGSSSIIEALGRAFLNRDDEVIMCMPTFYAFVDMAQTNGAKPVIVDMKEDMKNDLDGILAAITDKTKMIIICNPNNPTGTYIEEAKLKAFVEKVPDNIVVVFDEAYIEFAEAPDCKSMLETMKATTDKPIVILKTFSKYYGMAGARLGYALAQTEIIAELSKCGIGFDVSNITAMGAAAAMRDEEHGKYVLEQVRKWRKYLTDEMRAMGCKVFDSQTNFIFFDAGMEPAELQMKMMEKGIFMGGQVLSRVSIGIPEDNEYYIECLKEILAEKNNEVESKATA